MEVDLQLWMNRRGLFSWKFMCEKYIGYFYRISPQDIRLKCSTGLGLIFKLPWPGRAKTNKTFLNDLLSHSDVQEKKEQVWLISPLLYTWFWPEVIYKLAIQGDHSACTKPVDFKNKVPLWPALAWLCQSGTFVLMSTGGFAQAEWSPCTSIKNCQTCFSFPLPNDGVGRTLPLSRIKSFANRSKGPEYWT